MKKYFTSCEEETMKAAEEICRNIPSGVVAFSGGMGMGKTAFVRGALSAYNNTSHVSSPTFALVNDYGGTPHIYHFDMYRISGLDDLYSTGFFDYLDNDSVLFIEWSENITGFLPDDTVFIDIKRGGNENSREITVTGGVF